MFEWPLRVYIEDTDAGGIVYYANYLKFMERARTEWLRQLGFEQESLRQQDCLFVVQSLQLDYQRSARLDDELSVSVALERCGRASMVIHQQVMLAGEVLCRGQVRIACVNAAGRPRSFPNPIRMALADQASQFLTSKETM
ncbi:tol-pal system-associated acyl-CoA thioesterase [Bacterioplanes sanyensis]|uniref:tol-pal system-associated acyl-CoA thioesterase n=1 Tax=Bacterioplanes sanyensis TaxID=1249553 RepID=UPI00167A94BD|nr:tol-pal system-associated acyl-CoA thioesterase [Bacterioplanes sanyensis]GGY43779.1 tol-pal system-associated acyl-CoA thioesterase [Bacterioplanes sanyensis]